MNNNLTPVHGVEVKRVDIIKPSEVNGWALTLTALLTIITILLLAITFLLVLVLVLLGRFDPKTAKDQHTAIRRDRRVLVAADWQRAGRADGLPLERVGRRAGEERNIGEVAAAVVREAAECDHAEILHRDRRVPASRTRRSAGVGSGGFHAPDVM